MRRSNTQAVIYGLGPIGSAIARHVVERRGIGLVGAVDIDPAKVGKDVGTIIGLGRDHGLPVSASLRSVLETTEVDVVLHATSSKFSDFKPQIAEILEAGVDVVSTAEELSFPWLAHAVDAAAIDELAMSTGSTVLGTGVNPGFIMDTLPLALTSLCRLVTHIDVKRGIDATKRRGPFQVKIGCGLSVTEFEARIAAGTMGHVGLPESVGMVFDSLGRELVSFESKVRPLVAAGAIKTDHVSVQPGQVCGLEQVARGFTAEREFLRLTFLASVGAVDDGDTVRITGDPELEVRLKGTNGDTATVAIVVNAIPRVLAAPPGLVTMRDIPLVTHW